jgi:hypothetical protein
MSAPPPTPRPPRTRAERIAARAALILAHPERYTDAEREWAAKHQAPKSPPT